MVAAPQARSVAAPAVVSHEVNFQVKNTNETQLPCPTDGATSASTAGWWARRTSSTPATRIAPWS